MDPECLIVTRYILKSLYVAMKFISYTYMKIIIAYYVANMYIYSLGATYT